MFLVRPLTFAEFLDLCGRSLSDVEKHPACGCCQPATRSPNTQPDKGSVMREAFARTKSSGFKVTLRSSSSSLLLQTFFQ